MPDSGSPSATDSRRLEASWRSIRACLDGLYTHPLALGAGPCQRGHWQDRMELCAGAGRHCIPSRGVISVTPQGLAAVVRCGSDVSPKQEWWWLPAWGIIPALHHTSLCQQRSTHLLPHLSPAFGYLLQQFDTG